VIRGRGMDGTLPLAVSGSQRPSVPPLRRAALAAACVVIAATCAACGEGPNRTPAPADLAGLVVLTDDGGRPRLTTFDAAGQARSQAGASGPTAWISAGRRGTLIATMADGSLRLSDRIRADHDAAWKRVPGARVDLPGDPLYFATWAPSGNRLAALATDFSQDASPSLVVVDPLADTSLIMAVPGRALPVPPAWLDESRVLVETEAGTVILSVDGGDTTAGPDMRDGAALIDVSADGSRVAIGGSQPGPVTVRSRDAWLNGSGQPDASLGDGTVGAVAFDRRAERLAVIWQHQSAAAIVVIYRSEGGWHESSRLPLPGGSQRGVLTWLP
jgi:hypothetical protein